MDRLGKSLDVVSEKDKRLYFCLVYLKIFFFFLILINLF